LLLGWRQRYLAESRRTWESSKVAETATKISAVGDAQTLKIHQTSKLLQGIFKQKMNSPTIFPIDSPTFFSDWPCLTGQPKKGNLASITWCYHTSFEKVRWGNIACAPRQSLMKSMGEINYERYCSYNYIDSSLMDQWMLIYSFIVLSNILN